MWRLLPESSSEAAWRLVTPVKDAEMKLPALQVTCFSELGSRPEWQNVALMSRTLTAFSRRPDFWLRVAVLSGMLPLVLGLAVFAIHYYTRAAIWLTAGGVVILIGLAIAEQLPCGLPMPIRRGRANECRADHLDERIVRRAALNPGHLAPRGTDHPRVTPGPINTNGIDD